VAVSYRHACTNIKSLNASEPVVFRVLVFDFSGADLRHSSSGNGEPCSTPSGKCFDAAKRGRHRKSKWRTDPLYWLVWIQKSLSTEDIVWKKVEFYDAWVFQVLNDFISESQNISRWKHCENTDQKSVKNL